jgi:hypothetical protein
MNEKFLEEAEDSIKCILKVICFILFIVIVSIYLTCLL